MGIQAAVNQGRNELCKCRSGLKFKYCHGDPEKKMLCERGMAEIMFRLIMRERYKRKLITEEEYNKFLGKGLLAAGRTVTDKDVDEAFDQMGLKRCATPLCGTPIPDSQVLCRKCKLK
ncbi:hypothetical protein LCGC14_0720070 [marine sediment metagenome]|uniref:SEC-C motif domain protein n=1 Tax=marine sediment metagenome TaxID=412755 RepID=A0A0F9SY39_9ZZZZ